MGEGCAGQLHKDQDHLLCSFPVPQAGSDRPEQCSCAEAGMRPWGWNSALPSHVVQPCPSQESPCENLRPTRSEGCEGSTRCGACQQRVSRAACFRRGLQQLWTLNSRVPVCICTHTSCTQRLPLQPAAILLLAAPPPCPLAGSHMTAPAGDPGSSCSCQHLVSQSSSSPRPSSHPAGWGPRDSLGGRDGRG